MSERFGCGEYGSEIRHDPEVTELLSFLETYNKIQEIMAWLVEASAGADPTVTAVRRAQLYRLMQQLGLDPENGAAFKQLENIKLGLTDS